jgi:hyperosmotically inducible protein
MFSSYGKKTAGSLSTAAALLFAVSVCAGTPSTDGDTSAEAMASSAQTKVDKMADEVASEADDLRIHATLETKLAESDQLSALAINTDVEDGIVTLQGDVETDAQRELATEMARSISGVREVDNRLNVTSVDPGIAERVASNATDAAITTSVKTRLLASDNTSGLAIDVDTDDHVVTLTGQVDSKTERELAGLVAANTSGVNRVINELEVQPQYQ